MGKGSMTRESGWMTLWGLLFLYTGCQKIVNVIDTEQDFTSITGDHFPTAVLLAGAIAEIIYGTLGFFVGFLYLVYGQENPIWTRYSVLTQFMGVFTFTVFVLAEPSWRAGHLPDTFTLGNIDQSEYKGLLTNSIVGMSMYQLSLHIALLCSTLDFHNQQTKNVNYSSARGVAGLFNVISLIAGCSTLAMGARIHNLVDLCTFHCGRLFYPVYLIPFPVVWPTLFVCLGGVQILVALHGLVRIATKEGKSDDKGGLSLSTGLNILLWLLIITLSLLSNLGVDPSTDQTYQSWWAILVPLATSMCFCPVIYEAKYLTGKDFNTKDFL